MPEVTLSSSLIERLKKIQSNQEECTLASYDLLSDLRDPSNECLPQPVTGSWMGKSVEGNDPQTDISNDNDVSSFKVACQPSEPIRGCLKKKENIRNSNVEDFSNGNFIPEILFTANSKFQKPSSENINPKNPSDNRKFSYLKKGQGLSRFRSKAFKGFKGKENKSPLKCVKAPEQTGMEESGELQRENPNDFEQLEQLVSHPSFCSDSSTVLELLQRDCSTPLSCRLRPVLATDNDMLDLAWPVGQIFSPGNVVAPVRSYLENRLQESNKVDPNIDKKPYGIKGKHSGILKKSDQISPSILKVTLGRDVKVLEYEVDDEHLSNVDRSEDATLESINISDPELIPFLIENFQNIYREDPINSSPIENFLKFRRDDPSNTSFVENFHKPHKNDSTHSSLKDFHKLHKNAPLRVLRNDPSWVQKNEPVNSLPVSCHRRPNLDVISGTKQQNSIPKTSSSGFEQSEDDCKMLMLAKIYELEKEIEIFRRKNKSMEELIKELQLQKNHASNDVSKLKDQGVKNQEKAKSQQRRTKPTLKLKPQIDKAVADNAEMLKKELNCLKLEYNNLKRMFTNMQRQIATSRKKQDVRLESNLQTCSKSSDTRLVKENVFSLNRKTNSIKRPPLSAPMARLSTSKPKAVQGILNSQNCSYKQAIVIEKVVEETSPKQSPNNLIKVKTLANNNNHSDEVDIETEELEYVHTSSPSVNVDVEPYSEGFKINEQFARHTSDSFDIASNPKKLYDNTMEREISTLGNYKNHEEISSSGYLHTNPIKEHHGKMTGFKKASCLSTILEESISYSTNRNSVSEVNKSSNGRFVSVSTHDRTESKDHISGSLGDGPEIHPNLFLNPTNRSDTRKHAFVYQADEDRTVAEQQTSTEEIKMKREAFLSSGEKKQKVIQPISFLDRLAADDSIEIVDVVGRNVSFSETEEIEEITRVIQHDNGDKEIIYSSKKVYHYAANNSFHTVSKDGREEYRFANGQREIYFKDGSYEIRQPDQSGKLVNKDGTEVSVFSNGTKVTVYKSGLKIIDFPNGKKEVHEFDCTRLICPDGTIKTVFKDGRQETRYNNGLIRLKDSDGKVKLCKVDGRRFH